MTNEALQVEISELKMAAQTKGDPSKEKIVQLADKLEKSENYVNNLEKKVSDLKYDKKQLESAMASYALQNQQLLNERDEHLRFLEEARESLAKFRKKEEEYPFPSYFLILLPFIFPFDFP